MSSSTRRAPEQGALTPRVKVWLETEGRYAFGLGIGQILRAVEDSGSIKQAAADLGRSYRHVWGRIKQAERTLGRALVQTRVGGHGARRSSLTPEARRLTAAFLAFRDHMAHAARQEFQRCFG
jgi:molybdate transport repressor ModE-like protein